jgi:hypothetical protein
LRVRVEAGGRRVVVARICERGVDGIVVVVE